MVSRHFFFAGAADLAAPAPWAHWLLIVEPDVVPSDEPRRGGAGKLILTLVGHRHGFDLKPSALDVFFLTLYLSFFQRKTTTKKDNISKNKSSAYTPLFYKK